VDSSGQHRRLGVTTEWAAGGNLPTANGEPDRWLGGTASSTLSCDSAAFTGRIYVAKGRPGAAVHRKCQGQRSATGKTPRRPTPTMPSRRRGMREHPEPQPHACIKSGVARVSALNSEDLTHFLVAVDEVLGDPTAWPNPTGYPTSMALCLIECIYSLGIRYQAHVVPVLDRYRAYRRSEGAEPAHRDPERSFGGRQHGGATAGVEARTRSDLQQHRVALSSAPRGCRRSQA